MLKRLCTYFYKDPDADPKKQCVYRKACKPFCAL